MALSEEEQRLLEQLEASLAEDDPKLAQTLGKTSTPRQIHGRRATLAGVLFVLGLVLLVVGMRTNWIVSIFGFLAMLVATVVALGAWRKATGTAEKAKPTPPSSSEPFMGKMEDRWRRRQEGGL
ncbi:DUF3040 domain-containing protein [Propionimicrobium sp. PCR01-08-3]|uniref:DUF3040 domain-containing protein n=1 Tax=Propionimicrobium sp. PCR01-08-3 TaxID=3052086 RepID=UPI00255CF468|nr:DUF3040 domain-containing protein [Propionimicrobium sp. PCR01-08-3]WIY81658.1 DUF3040 domain-containing protein [Propionimicrobium sp. PCR01-08-3]